MKRGVKTLLNNSRFSLSAITLIVLLVTTIAVPQAFAQERQGDAYSVSSSFTTQSDPTACNTATQPTQCAVLKAGIDPLPQYVAAVIEAQGGLVQNPESCDIILLSSGNPLDNDFLLSTDMNAPFLVFMSPEGGECRDASGALETNPDGFPTYDCVDVTVTPPENALVLAWSAEWPEFLGSTFTDWDRIGGEVSVSIEDWAGGDGIAGNENDVDSLVLNPTFGPNDIGSVTEGNIAAGVTVTLRVADSGDEVLDTGKIVIPISCLDDPNLAFLCGNGDLDPGETCDDGNQVDGDGCSSACTEEPNGNGKDQVGGDFIPLDSTALLIAGMSSNLGLIAPIVAGIAGASAFYIKTRMSKE